MKQAIVETLIDSGEVLSVTLKNTREEALKSAEELAQMAGVDCATACAALAENNYYEDGNYRVTVISATEVV